MQVAYECIEGMQFAEAHTWMVLLPCLMQLETWDQGSGKASQG